MCVTMIGIGRCCHGWPRLVGDSNGGEAHRSSKQRKTVEERRRYLLQGLVKGDKLGSWINGSGKE